MLLNKVYDAIQFLLYTMPDDEGKVQVVVKDETLWCTQKAMAQLFAVGAAPCLLLGALKVEPLTFNLQQ